MKLPFFDFFANIGIGEEKIFFIENLSMLLASGMTISTAIAAIKTDLRSPRMKELVTNIEADVNAGVRTSVALEKTQLLPAQIISLIRVGEETGHLAQNLKVIVSLQHRELAFTSKVRSAMLYPVLVLGLTFVIGVGVTWFILPRLATVFGQLDVDLPLITRVLIAGGTFLGTYGIVVVPTILVLAVCAAYMLFGYPKTKAIGQNLLLLVPGVGKLVLEVEISRMGYLLGTLLASGIPVVDALSSLSRATNFQKYRKFYEFLKVKVEEGNSFQKSFSFYPGSSRFVPTPVQQMIVAGSQSGSLSDTLLKIGTLYEEKIDITMKNLTTLIEPVLLVFVWMGVVAVALAVILPVYSLIGGLNKPMAP